MLAKIADLEREVDELKNGEDRLVARIKNSYESEKFDSVSVYAAELERRFPESGELMEMEKLVEKAEDLLEKQKAAALAAAQERERLANLNNTGIWEVTYYVDDFGAPTKSGYIRNSSLISGTFSNTATEDSDLNVRFLINSYKDISIMLFEYAGNNPVKAYSTDDYRIRMRANGGTYDMNGTNYGDRIRLEESDAAKVHNAFKKGGEVMFYIVERETPTTNYSFRIAETKYYDNAYRILTTGK